MDTLLFDYLPEHFAVIMGRIEEYNSFAEPIINIYIVVYKKDNKKPVKLIKLPNFTNETRFIHTDEYDNIIVCADKKNLAIWNILEGKMYFYKTNYPTKAISKDLIILLENDKICVYNIKGGKLKLQIDYPKNIPAYAWWINHNKLIIDRFVGGSIFDLNNGTLIKDLLGESKPFRYSHFYKKNDNIYDIFTDKIVSKAFNRDNLDEYCTDTCYVSVEEDGVYKFDYASGQKEKFKGNLRHLMRWVRINDSNVMLLTDYDDIDFGEYDGADFQIIDDHTAGIYLKDIESIPTKIIKLLPALRTTALTLRRAYPQEIVSLTLYKIFDELLRDKGIETNEKLIRFLIDYTMNKQTDEITFRQKIIELI